MNTKALHIFPIPALVDNYIWLLHNNRDAVVIDPGDAKPVIEVLEKQQLQLSAILITHYHADHIDGVLPLLKHASVPVYAPKYEQFPFPHIAVSEGESINIDKIDLTFNVLWLPGHTLGHIAYLNEFNLFCGDVLFSAGCGRLFEGTPKQMLSSLKRLTNLNKATKVYCTHEYTSKNISFARTLEPENKDLIKKQAEVTRLRKNNQPTLPSTIELELKINPYLRCDSPAIIANSGAKSHDELSVFSKIRTLRNHY